MKTINRLAAIALGMSLLVANGMALAHGTQEEVADQKNARSIKVEKQKDGPGDATKRAGDPIPDIDITIDQAYSVCQAGTEDCNDGGAPVDPGASPKGGAKFKAGKALAETVKKVDDGGDVKHIDQDSDDDGLDDQ